MNNDEVVRRNSAAWDKLSGEANRWTVSVGPEEIAEARRGELKLLLTESKYVPREWFPEILDDVEVLCLASGGGQQAPLLAAAGASVTSFDNSAKQLEADRIVAEREGLSIRTVQGDMRDLSVFPDASFDLIFNAVSNCFVPDLEPVWREAYRVLRPGGALLVGILNPVEFIFDHNEYCKGNMVVRFKLPYSDTESLTPEEHIELEGEDGAYVFSHSLETQIGGQLKAGFLLTGLFEAERENMEAAKYFPSYIATRAVKQER